jgi:hypothetical protein
MDLHIGKAKADEGPGAVQGMIEPWGSGGGGAGMGAGRGGFGGGDGFPEGLGVGTGDEGFVVALEGYGEVRAEDAEGETVAGTAVGWTAQNASAWARVTRARLWRFSIVSELPRLVATAAAEVASM